MKVGLYSITYLGIWYRGRALTMAEVVDRAVAHGYDGVEIDGKRPHGNPMDWDARAKAEIRDLCTSRGIDIVGVASNNDFSSPVPEYRDCQLLMVREQVRLCRELGGKVVRLFFAWPGVTLDARGLAAYEMARGMWAENSRYSTRIEQWGYVRDCLREAARYAEDAGVVLALQNHTPLLRHYRDMLDMIRDVDSPALRASLDVPILERQDSDYVWQAARETGSLQEHSHFGGEFERADDGIVRQRDYEFGRAVPNYSTFVKAMKQLDYDGYFCFEFCHPALNERHEVAGLEYVDEQAGLAAEYFRNLLIAEGVYTGRASLAAR
jgi:sugar phosphate isomerase/epimerase